MRIEAINQPGIAEIHVGDQVISCCSLREQQRLMYGLGLMDEERLNNFYERLKARRANGPQLPEPSSGDRG